MSKEPLLREYQAAGYGNNRIEAFKDFYRQAKILTVNNSLSPEPKQQHNL